MTNFFLWIMACFSYFCWFSLICLHWIEVMITSQPSISSPVTITLSFSLAMKFKIPFVLEDYPVWFFKYFNVVLLLPAWNLQHLSEYESSIALFFFFSFCTIRTDKKRIMVLVWVCGLSWTPADLPFWTMFICSYSRLQTSKILIVLQ